MWRVILIVIAIILIGILYFANETLRESAILKFINAALKLEGPEFNLAAQEVTKFLDTLLTPELTLTYDVTGDDKLLLEIYKIFNTSDDIKRDMIKLLNEYKEESNEKIPSGNKD